MTVVLEAPVERVEATRRVTIRYVVMALHFALILTTLVQAFVQGNNALSLLIHAISLTAFVVYVPAAAYLCRKGRRSSFDHAAGEVAYTAVQSAIWGFSIATAFLAIAMSSCTEYVPRPVELESADNLPPQTRWMCSRFLVTAILSICNFVLVAGWMVWVIVEVYKRFPGKVGSGFKTSMGWVLRKEVG